MFVAEWMSRNLADYFARRGMNVLMAPPVEHGTAVLSRSYAGSTSVRRCVLQDFLVDVLASFAENGFCKVVATSCHVDPPYVMAWEEACCRVNSAYGTRMVHGFERLVLEDIFGRELGDVLGTDVEGDTHAGVLETSIMLYLRPGLVDRILAASLEEIRVNYEQLRSATSFRQVGNGLGYTGNPKEGTEWRGRVLLQRWLRRYKEVLDRYLSGEDVFERLSIRALLTGLP
jgi:creatinine amidohydrolase/Fe(II)-dependent formamide hydrolase-like protein